MLRAWSRELDVLLQVADITGSAIVFVWVVSLPGMAPDAGELAWRTIVPLALAASLTWPIALRILNLTKSMRTERIPVVASQFALAGVSTAFALSAVAFLTAAPVAAQVPILCGLAQLLILGGLRVLLHLSLRRFRRTGKNTRNVLIAGSGPRALYVETVIEQHPSWGLRVIGFVDDEIPENGKSQGSYDVFPIQAVPELLSDQVVDEVIVACPRSKLEQMVSVVDYATAAGVPTTLLSDIFGELLPVPVVKRFGALPALTFAPVHHDAGALVLKRAVDVVGASLGLLLSAPVLGAACLAIRITDPGPVLFHQVRCSLNGRLFTMPKLRTMKVGADEMRAEMETSNEMDGPVFKMQHDPRITRLGSFLRKFSLDELPQLWSVLKGDMSLVGPRPAIPDEVAAYQTFERRRLSMRPGLTCLWQVSGRNQIGFDDWVRLDLEYIDTWSLVNDFRILARTVPAVLSGDGAS
jgi:exopolysaccharide biosynthesis polyprenyl glycosylphosphotransferase